jgi:hypothetical protein
MPLVQETWTAVSVHKVLLGWLRAERDTNANIAHLLKTQQHLRRLVDNPDVRDPEENRARLRLFYSARWPFFFEIPPDTVWYEVQSVSEAHFSELRAVNFGHWNDAADQNELEFVAARKKLALRGAVNWEGIVLWGHDKTGPFSIFEGNHRLSAYAYSKNTGLSIPVFVGLSPLKCHWHILDAAPILFQDLAHKL